MKIVIYGSRTLPSDHDHLIFMHLDDAVVAMCRALSFTGKPIVVSGCAGGADKLGERFAAANHLEVVKYPANWELYGKRAGFVRNAQMAREADAGIELWDGRSKGTYHMRQRLMELSKPVFGYQFGFRLWHNTDTEDGWISL